MSENNNTTDGQETFFEDNSPESSLANPISEGVSSQNDSDDDAMLDEIMGSLEEEGPSTPVIEESPVIESTDSETNAEPGDDYFRALAALQRDGTPRSVLDQLYNENPQDFIDWGLKREKVQRDGDRFSSEFNELKQKMQSDMESNNNQEPNMDQTRPSPVSDAFQKYSDDLSEVFGEEAATTLMGPMRNMALMLGELYATVNSLNTKNEQAELSSTRSSLQDQYPELTKDDAYDGVIEKMKTLYKTGEYSNIKDLMTDAARMSFSQSSAAPSQNQKDMYALITNKETHQLYMI